jgi:hypothetical protein
MVLAYPCSNDLLIPCPWATMLQRLQERAADQRIVSLPRWKNSPRALGIDQNPRVNPITFVLGLNLYNLPTKALRISNELTN